MVLLAQKSWTEWRWAAERDRLNTTGSRSKCGSVDHIQEPDHVLSLGKPLTCFQQTFFRKLILPALGRARGRQETGGQKGGLWSNQGGKGWCLKDGDGDRKKWTHQEEIQEKASRGKASCSERRPQGSSLMTHLVGRSGGMGQVSMKIRKQSLINIPD